MKLVDYFDRPKHEASGSTTIRVSQLAIEILELQIAEALNQRGYFLALLGALCLPDMASALSSEDGEASGEKYVAWYETWVRPQYAEYVAGVQERAGLPPIQRPIPHPLTGEMCYAYRCAMLHQGRAHHAKMGYTRIMFLEPGSHENGIQYVDVGGPLLVKLETFCGQILEGVRRWRAAVCDNEDYKRNLAKTVQRYPETFGQLRFGATIIT